MTLEFIKNRAWVIKNVVPKEICEKYIEKIDNQNKYKKCKYNNNIDTNYRNSYETKINSKTDIEMFWKHMKKYIPKKINNKELIGIHKSKVYVLKYGKGQYFKPHYDGYSEDCDKNRSELTVLVYLNILDKNCGGSTRFYAQSNNNILFVKPYEKFSTYDTTVDAGSMVVFKHKTVHAGMPINKGYKYCVRFNILYKIKTDK